MEPLHEEALRLFQELLRSLREGGEDHVASLGPPPRVIYVARREPSDHAFLNLGEVVEQWKVTEDAFVELSPNEVLPPHGASERYFEAPRGDFALLADPARLRVSWQLAPRFGEGLEYSVVDGRVTGGPRRLWIS